MDKTDIFLSKISSKDVLYKKVADTLGDSDITDSTSLSAFLDSIKEPVDYRIYISKETTEGTPAEEALDCFKRFAENNSDAKVEIKEDEFLNLIDENDRITSESMPRSLVHHGGQLHPTVHIWFTKRRDMGVHVLLQKRSHEKDVYPDCYDVSAAGHVTQGDEFRHTAIKEVREELGIDIPSIKLDFLGMRHCDYINGDIHDNELIAVYLYRGEIHKKELTLQESEVSEVCWADADELISFIKHGCIDSCISLDELKMIKKAVY